MARSRPIFSAANNICSVRASDDNVVGCDSFVSCPRWATLLAVHCLSRRNGALNIFRPKMCIHIDCEPVLLRLRGSSHRNHPHPGHRPHARSQPRSRTSTLFAVCFSSLARLHTSFVVATIPFVDVRPLSSHNPGFESAGIDKHECKCHSINTRHVLSQSYHLQPSSTPVSITCILQPR